MLPVLSWLIFLFSVARIILFAAALKFPSICRSYLYLELMICALTALAPRSAYLDWDFMIQTYLQTIVLNFCLFYCNFWPSLIGSNIVMIFVLGSGSVVYDQSTTNVRLIALGILLVVF